MHYYYYIASFVAHDMGGYAAPLFFLRGLFPLTFGAEQINVGLWVEHFKRLNPWAASRLLDAEITQHLACKNFTHSRHTYCWSSETLNCEKVNKRRVVSALLGPHQHILPRAEIQYSHALKTRSYTFIHTTGETRVWTWIISALYLLGFA